MKTYEVIFNAGVLMLLIMIFKDSPAWYIYLCWAVGYTLEEIIIEWMKNKGWLQ